MADLRLPRDTTLDAARVHYASLAKIGPAGRARMAFQLSESLRHISEAGIKHRHPEYTPRQVQLAAIGLALGDELFREVYGVAAPES